MEKNELLKKSANLRKNIDEWRKKWDTNKVPGCRQENCSKCSTHHEKKISCPLQVNAYREEFGVH